MGFKPRSLWRLTNLDYLGSLIKQRARKQTQKISRNIGETVAGTG